MQNGISSIKVTLSIFISLKKFLYFPTLTRIFLIRDSVKFMLHPKTLISGQLVSQNVHCPAAWSDLPWLVSLVNSSTTSDMATDSGMRMVAGPHPSHWSSWLRSDVSSCRVCSVTTVMIWRQCRYVQWIRDGKGIIRKKVGEKLSIILATSQIILNLFRHYCIQ